MPLWGSIGALCAVVGYLVFTHFALAHRQPRLALAALVCVCGISLSLRARRRASRWGTVLASVAILVALGAVPQSERLDWIIFVPPVLVNAILCWAFGRTLRRGRVPMVTVFARHAHGGELAADLVVYTRRVTWVWTAFFAAMAAIAASLAVAGPVRAWSLFVNFGNPVLIAALFLGEYAWRRVRYRHHRHTTLLDMLQYLRLPQADNARLGAPLQSHPVMRNLPLLRMHAMNDNVAWKNGQPISAAEFIEAAGALAAALPARRYVLNLCRDRYHFIVGLGAAMIARRVTLLPPGYGEAAMRDIRRDFGDLCCLADHGDSPAGIETVRVPALARGPALSDPAWSMGEIPAFPGEQEAAIVFTSGSTGPPTPHVKSWGSLVRGALALGRHLGLTPTSRPSIVGTVPPQHMFGLETTVMLPLQWRGAVDAGQPLLPFDVKAAVDATPAPRWLMTTPLQLHACASDGIDLRGSLRGVISSTMPLDAGLARSAEELWECPVEEIYGCSETGMIAMRRSASGPAWTLCEGVRLQTQDGETHAAGGHIEQPYALADRVDMAGRDSFRLLGRASDLIKVAGKRTSLEALNARLRKVPGVADGVFYVPSAPENRAGRLAAFAVAPETTAAAILAALRKDLDPLFLPRPLYLVDALPRTANGKITLDALEALARSMSARRYSDDLSSR